MPTYLRILALLRTIAFSCLFMFWALPANADSVGDILSPGQLIQGHAKVEGECAKCHKRFDKAAQNTLCKDCHKDIAKDITEMRGFHGRLKEQKDCKECHTDHKGRDAKIVIFSSAKFDHAQTNFQLKGGHLNDKVQCKDCHLAAKKFREAPSVCISCHKKDDKHKGGLGKDCANCHEEKDWKTTRFDHGKTDFKLLGKHAEVKCKECHIDEKFKDTAKQCNACHKKDDKHKGNFGAKCETCHVEKNWKDILFDHAKQTKYPLRWKHNELKCTSCHKGDLHKEKLQTDCLSCHKKDDKHKGNFGQKCESCHLEKGWKEILFDHAKKTKYPLLGKHLTAKCSSCHKGDLLKEKLPMDCMSCHRKDDKHKGNFGTKCESCHVEKDWKEILFDHTKSTKYPLLFKHKEVKCGSCHKGDIYKDKLQTRCISCHENDDKHKGQEGKKCESCHNEQSWTKAKFDHGQSTFPLLGKHFLVDCKKCHASPAFKDAKSDCWSCHEKEDVHKRRLGTACDTCHNMRNWKAWDFDHNKTNFKLEGPHSKLGCYECHKQPMNKKLSVSSTCGTCHASDDVHNGEYGRQCERCHIGTTWKKVKVGGKFIR
jgi:hypothetical protein